MSILAEVSPDAAFWVAIIAAIAAAVSPLVIALIQSRTNIKLAEINARTQKIETETAEIKTEAQGQKAKLDEAMVVRKEIDARQSTKLDNLSKSGQQQERRG